MGKHLAGKTGTTNEAKDLWFVGFSPDLAFGVFMGYDQPRSLGDSAQAALYTAPIFRDFMKMALKDQPDTPFRVPPGIKLISVDVHTGMRSSGPGSILEAFKPGTAPPDSYASGESVRRIAARAHRLAGRREGDRRGNRRALLSGPPRPAAPRRDASRKNLDFQIFAKNLSGRNQ